MTAPGPRGLGERWRAAAEDTSLLVNGLVSGLFFATIRFAVPGSTASGHVVRALVEGARGALPASRLLSW